MPIVLGDYGVNKLSQPHLLAQSMDSGSLEPTESRHGIASDLTQNVRGNSSSGVQVMTLFVTAEYGMLLQDAFPLEPPLEALLGVQVPQLFFTPAVPEVLKQILTAVLAIVMMDTMIHPT